MESINGFIATYSQQAHRRMQQLSVANSSVLGTETISNSKMYLVKVKQLPHQYSTQSKRFFEANIPSANPSRIEPQTFKTIDQNQQAPHRKTSAKNIFGTIDQGHLAKRKSSIKDQFFIKEKKKTQKNWLRKEYLSSLISPSKQTLDTNQKVEHISQLQTINDSVVCKRKPSPNLQLPQILKPSKFLPKNSSMRSLDVSRELVNSRSKESGLHLMNSRSKESGVHLMDPLYRIQKEYCDKLNMQKLKQYKKQWEQRCEERCSKMSKKSYSYVQKSLVERSIQKANYEVNRRNHDAKVKKEGCVFQESLRSNEKQRISLGKLVPELGGLIGRGENKDRMLKVNSNSDFYMAEEVYRVDRKSSIQQQ